MKKKLSVIILCLLMVFTFGACNLFGSAMDRPYSADSKYQEPLEIGQTITASKIVETYLDACVTVVVYTTSTNQQYSIGSGVCVYKGGYIATNYHVASYGASSSYKLKVFINGNTKDGYDAELLWSNQQVDLAIIQCTNGDIPYVQMADRVYNTTNPISPLEEVIAIGTPLELSLQNTYTLGYVSGLNRASISDGNLYQDLIQHTAPINHGNSGGPLFDMNGNLIGLNTLGVDDANSLFFAVPIYPVMIVLDKIVSLNENSTRDKFQMPKIGVSAYDKLFAEQVTDVTYTGDYVYITESTNANIKANDEIKSIKTANNHVYEITNRNKLVLALLDSDVGDVAEFTIVRDGKELKVDITLTA